MHDAIADVHPSIAATFKHVDHSTEPRLERILAEIRGESARPAHRMRPRRKAAIADRVRPRRRAPPPRARPTRVP